MSAPASPPKNWGKALSGFDDDHFSQRVKGCYSKPHLYAAVRYEAEHKGRTERVAQLNQRLSEVQE